MDQEEIIEELPDSNWDAAGKPHRRSAPLVAAHHHKKADLAQGAGWFGPTNMPMRTRPDSEDDQDSELLSTRVSTDRYEDPFNQVQRSTFFHRAFNRQEAPSETGTGSFAPVTAWDTDIQDPQTPQSNQSRFQLLPTSRSLPLPPVTQNLRASQSEAKTIQVQPGTQPQQLCSQPSGVLADQKAGLRAPIRMGLSPSMRKMDADVDTMTLVDMKPSKPALDDDAPMLNMPTLHASFIGLSKPTKRLDGYPLPAVPANKSSQSGSSSTPSGFNMIPDLPAYKKVRAPPPHPAAMADPQEPSKHPAASNDDDQQESRSVTISGSITPAAPRGSSQSIQGHFKKSMPPVTPAVHAAGDDDDTLSISSLEGEDGDAAARSSHSSQQDIGEPDLYAAATRISSRMSSALAPSKPRPTSGHDMLSTRQPAMMSQKVAGGWTKEGGKRVDGFGYDPRLLDDDASSTATTKPSMIRRLLCMGS